MVNQEPEEVEVSTLARISYSRHGIMLPHVAADSGVTYTGGHPATQLNNQIVRIALDAFPGNVWNLLLPEGLYWLGLIYYQRKYFTRAIETLKKIKGDTKEARLARKLIPIINKELLRNDSLK